MGEMQSGNNRHAYLIMAHHDFEQLGKLLAALDDVRNDIYLHVDKKSGAIDTFTLMRSVSFSNIYLIERKNVVWGHYSLVECELRLLKAATDNGQYRYYHLLSGQDFPIRSQDYIHSIFDNSDLEYITSWDNMPEEKDARNYTDTYKYFYLLNKFDLRREQLKIINARLLKIQKALKIDRTKRLDVEIFKGDQWFSITDDFARYLLAKKVDISKLFRFTMAPDELVVATIASDSSFKDRIAGENYRLIDWNRGTPYFYKESDLDEIIASGKLFVRKVSTETSGDLARKLSEYIRKQTNEI